MNNLIFYLNFLFTSSIFIWAFCAYTEMWSYRNLYRTFEIIARLLKSDTQYSFHNPPDYLIAQGTYKGRRVVCRLNRLIPSQLLHYKLDVHIYIEPMKKSKSIFSQRNSLTKNTQLNQDNRIYYHCTSSTVIKSYLFASKITQYDFINIFEELTQAAEIVESESRNE